MHSVNSPSSIADVMTAPLKCFPLPPFSPDDWQDVARAFEDTDRCFLGQHWLPKPEVGFQSASVCVGWQADALWVYAELYDEDIFNRVTDLNQIAIEQGDVFEIFLRPEGAETYFEFHVTPENNVLQLRWPSSETYRNLPRVGTVDERLAPYFLAPQLIDTWTHIDREEKKWRVLVSINWEVLERQPLAGGETWTFSFSRYDDARHWGKPMLSSSSLHPKADFHRQQDWGTLTFEFQK